MKCEGCEMEDMGGVRADARYHDAGCRAKAWRERRATVALAGRTCLNCGGDLVRDFVDTWPNPKHEWTEPLRRGTKYCTVECRVAAARKRANPAALSLTRHDASSSSSR